LVAFSVITDDSNTQIHRFSAPQRQGHSDNQLKSRTWALAEIAKRRFGCGV